ncbi:hypothetical protein B0H14DRAFT_3740943 [Mycena olivaceomarginata]|nr:hypothetical protein B0H14DRAFT_3740943 [Mycena olivaceomarginata]
MFNYPAEAKDDFISDVMTEIFQREGRAIQSILTRGSTTTAFTTICALMQQWQWQWQCCNTGDQAVCRIIPNVIGARRVTSFVSNFALSLSLLCALIGLTIYVSFPAVSSTPSASTSRTSMDHVVGVEAPEDDSQFRPIMSKAEVRRIKNRAAAASSRRRRREEFHALEDRVAQLEMENAGLRYGLQCASPDGLALLMSEIDLLRAKLRATTVQEGEPNADEFSRLSLPAGMRFKVCFGLSST